MMKIDIPCPNRLNLENSLSFVNRLRDTKEAEEYCFDFTRLSYTSPFAFAYVSHEIGEFIKRKKGISRVFAVGHQGKNYHAHMGFFQAFGLKHGNKPGEAKGSGNYLPITQKEVKDFHDKAYFTDSPVGEVIEESSKRIAEILTQSQKGDILETLTYSLREIIRNVVEHSESPKVTYCAQYWPTQDRVEIVVMDSGRGIKESLKNNPFLEIENDHDAIHMALLPSVSGKMYKGIKVRKYDVWQNSGYGLYMTSRLCRHGGDFFIGSGNCGFSLKDKDKKYYDFKFEGTIIRMVLRPSEIGKLQPRLLQFSKDGNDIARGLKGTRVLASKASQMLTNDFN